MPAFESSSIPDGVTPAPAGAEPKKESLLKLTGPHTVISSSSSMTPLPATPTGPAKESIRPGTGTVSRVTRVLVGPHSIEALPTALSEEEVRIIELHDLGQKLGITLWNTDYEAAINPEHERFQMYNQLSLLDDGTLMLIEIKPGAEFTRTLQIDPERIPLQKSELVAAIRGHIKQAGFEWNKKPEGYLRADVSINEYRALTKNYNAATDKEKLEAMMDSEGSKRSGAIFAFDREVILLPDDPRIIFRLEGSHKSPENKFGPYVIDDVPHIIRK